MIQFGSNIFHQNSGKKVRGLNFLKKYKAFLGIKRSQKKSEFVLPHHYLYQNWNSLLITKQAQEKHLAATVLWVESLSDADWVSSATKDFVISSWNFTTGCEILVDTGGTICW